MLVRRTVENVKVDDDGSTHIIFAPPARERELYERSERPTPTATFRLIERPAADPPASAGRTDFAARAGRRFEVG